MALDTKYRPVTFSDVTGQEKITKLLRRYIATGKGLHQSYLLAGPYGNGKTTLGRILARGLLCPTPTSSGDPCDQCESCQDVLAGKSMDFTEIDAATNSGKEYMVALTEELQYSTISGRQRIYLFDEAHQLTANALDAMLKPLEEALPDGNKRLVCIFCTTEPAKMRETILSRCAPAFTVEPVPPAVVTKRLAYICDQEGISYDVEVLSLIAELTESHFRNALKAIEGISLLGKVDLENAKAYLKLDAVTVYLDILEALGKDLKLTIQLVEGLAGRASTATIYQQLADTCLWSYRTGLGLKPPLYMLPDRLMALYQQHREGLLNYIVRLGSRPNRPSPAMLLCDLAALHYGNGKLGGEPMQITVVHQAPSNGVVTAPSEDVVKTVQSFIPNGNILQGSAPAPVLPKLPNSNPILGGRTVDGVYRDDRCVRKIGGPETPKEVKGVLDVAAFSHLLGLSLRNLELGADSIGPQRHPDLGRH